MAQTLQLRIKRNKSFVGCVMGMKIYFNNIEIYTLSNGESAILTIPAVPGYLEFKMVGSSLSPHPIINKAFIDPTACRHNTVDCQLNIIPNWPGIMTSGLFAKVGTLKINLTHL